MAARKQRLLRLAACALTLGAIAFSGPMTVQAATQQELEAMPKISEDVIDEVRDILGDYEFSERYVGDARDFIKTIEFTDEDKEASTRLGEAYKQMLEDSGEMKFMPKTKAEIYQEIDDYDAMMVDLLIGARGKNSPSDKMILLANPDDAKFIGFAGSTHPHEYSHIFMGTNEGATDFMAEQITGYHEGNGLFVYDGMCEMYLGLQDALIESRGLETGKTAMYAELFEGDVWGERFKKCFDEDITVITYKEFAQIRSVLRVLYDRGENSNHFRELLIESLGLKEDGEVRLSLITRFTSEYRRIMKNPNSPELCSDSLAYIRKAVSEYEKLPFMSRKINEMPLFSRSYKVRLINNIVIGSYWGVLCVSTVVCAVSKENKHRKNRRIYDKLTTSKKIEVQMFEHVNHTKRFKKEATQNDKMLAMIGVVNNALKKMKLTPIADDVLDVLADARLCLKLAMVHAEKELTTIKTPARIKKFYKELEGTKSRKELVSSLNAALKEQRVSKMAGKPL